LTFDKYPFPKRMTKCLLFLYELPPGKTQITHYNEDKPSLIKM